VKKEWYASSGSTTASPRVIVQPELPWKSQCNFLQLANAAWQTSWDLPLSYAIVVDKGLEMAFVRTLVLGSSKITPPQAVFAEPEQMTMVIVLQHPGDNRV
jgi:hypothetical protein